MYSPTKGDTVFEEYLKKGFKKSGNSNKEKGFNIVATVFARLCEEHEVEEYLRPARTTYTLYVGGMGAKDKNFYFNLMCEYGYEEIATEIQNLYLSGKKQEAEELFPEDLLRDLTLVGTKKDNHISSYWLLQGTCPRLLQYIRNKRFDMHGTTLPCLDRPRAVAG